MGEHIYSLGILRGHNSGACLVKDGEVVALVSEERFNRIKNTNAFPFRSVEYCLSHEGIGVGELDFAVYSSAQIGRHDIEEFGHNDDYASTGVGRYWAIARVLQNSKAYAAALKLNYALFSRGMGEEGVKQCLHNAIKVPKEKALGNDHHANHAYAAFYGFCPQKEDKALVITADAEGDLVCSRVFVSEGNALKCIATTPGGRSFAAFYGIITQLLGMKMNEHEYKIMGMAPYASEYEKNKVLPVFEKLFWVNDDLTVGAKIEGYTPLYYYLAEKLHRKRFDGICAAAQEAAENWSAQLVKKAIAKTGIKKVVLSGGFFMNVKANMKISQMQEVGEIYPCPSCGDESLPIGAAFHGYLKACEKKGAQPKPKPLENLYLGPQFSSAQIESALEKADAHKKYSVEKPADIEKEAAQLLCQGEAVARFAGRMEFGARALGNRSILADPSRRDIIRVINDQIKNRHFWMPSASSILKEREGDYLVNPKNVDGSFMIITFETTPLARKELIAGLHPYDFTCRPQIVSKEANPQYWQLIRHFEKKTGIGGVLNTSFNIHGEPIVCSPEDALSVFERSGLRNMALGQFLVRKR